MCRRRFFKSYFYINYSGVTYTNGETVPVSPFPAAGGSVTIELVAARPWQITNNSWLSISSIQDKSGTYTITLTASANQSYSSRSGSFIAKTLDERNRIVVSFSQEPQASEKYLYIVPSTVNMDAEDTFNSLVCHFVYNGTDTVVTPTWSDDSSVLQVSANGVLTSNNTDPDPVNGIVVTATYVHDGDTLTGTATVNVAAATIQRFITVTPVSLGTAATWTQQLQVIYHQIVNGHEYTEDVTNDADTSYVSDSQIITVNGTGLVTANNTGSTTENATITVTYDDVTPVDVPAVAAPANVEYRNLYVEPSGMTLGKGDEEQIQAFVEEWVNGQYVRDIEVTLSATWTSDDDDIAEVSRSGNNEVVTPVYKQGEYYPTTRNTFVTATYLSSADTCDVEVEPEGIVWYEIEVTPTTKTLSYGETYNGVRVTYYVVTDGVRDAGTDVTTTSTYSPDNSATTVSVGANAVTLTGNNTGTSNQDTVITVSYPNCQPKTITVTNLASVYNPNIEWEDDEIEFPAYWTESTSLVERFDFVDINPSTVGVEVIDGENLEASNLYVGASYGSSDIVPSSFNYETERQFLGTVRVSGFGPDGVAYYDDLNVYQEAGVEPYLHIEGVDEYTEARSVVDAAELDFDIEFEYIDPTTLFISGYDGNISVASINANKDTLSVSLDANTALTPVTSELYIVAQTVYRDEIAAHLIITQPAYVPTCSLVWDVNNLCGDTKYITVAAYRPGNYEQDDLIETVGYIPQNVSNISLSIVSDTNNMIDSSSLVGNNRAQYVIYVNPLNTERYAIVRIEGNGADGNTYHDDLIIFQRYVEPDLLVNGSAVYNVTVNSAFTGNDYTLVWHYADPDSVGIVSYNGFITSCTMGQKTIGGDDGECDITVEMAPNTGSSYYESAVIFSGYSVLGTVLNATLRINQQPQDVPLITLTWNYSVHFIGRPPQNNFSIRFDLYNGDDEKIWDNDLAESSYDDSQVNQTFSDTATFSVPASTSFAGLYAENSPQYTGQYWETVKKVGNVITTELVVPSVEPIELDIHIQAFSDTATGSFPFEITLQSLSYEDQTPVSDAWVTQSTTETGSTTIDVLANTGNTVPATLAFQDFRTRMGYWLGIHVDNQDTGTYSDIAVVIEDGTHQLVDVPVVGSGGEYRIFVGGANYDWDNGDLFIKFIDDSSNVSGITNYSPSRIIWGTWGSDDLDITVDFKNVDSFVIDWDDSELDIPSFRITGGTKTGGTGPSYMVYPGETVIPTSTSGTLVLYTDVSVIVSGASSLTNTGNINITSYSNNGQAVDTESIACDS